MPNIRLREGFLIRMGRRVNVFVGGTIEGASTDKNGEFTFQTTVAGDTVLIFRHIAMEEVRLAVNIHSGMPVLTIDMREKEERFSS